MEEAKYLDLMAKYLSGNLTGPEKEHLFAWVEGSDANRKFFEELIQLWSISSGYETGPFEADVAKAWKRIEGRLEERPGFHLNMTGADAGTPSAKMIPLSNFWRLQRIAAVVLLVVLAAWWLWSDPAGWRNVEIRTAHGERRQVELPDGSRVWLNERTTLAYRWPFRERRVTLSGEAFFEVERMVTRPFVIQSGEAMTTVLGTSFNMRAYAGERQVEVTVKTGRVRLEDSRKAEAKVDIDAGSTGVLDRETQQAKAMGPETVNAFAWKTRILNFENLPLREVIPAMERYFGIRISVANEDIYHCTFLGTYPDPDLKDLLNALDFALEDVQIETQNDSTYLFLGKGCL